MNITRLLAAALSVSISVAAGAQNTAAGSTSTGAAVVAGGSMTEGEVRKIDSAQGTVTLKHGRIENLDMPGMTMVFKAADPKLLKGLKPGDKVRFHAEQRGEVLSVTAIQAVR